jgi:hypothetical protein
MPQHKTRLVLTPHPRQQWNKKVIKAFKDRVNGVAPARPTTPRAANGNGAGANSRKRARKFGPPSIPKRDKKKNELDYEEDDDEDDIEDYYNGVKKEENDDDDDMTVLTPSRPSKKARTSKAPKSEAKTARKSEPMSAAASPSKKIETMDLTDDASIKQDPEAMEDDDSVVSRSLFGARKARGISPSGEF